MNKLGMVVSLLTLLSLAYPVTAPAREIKVINAANVDAALMTDVVSFCNEQLPFTLTSDSSANCACANAQACQESILALKTDNDAAIIGLVSVDDPNFHQTINTNRMVALINVKPLIIADNQQTTWRLQRMLMRSVAFLLGIAPAPDPHCVTRHYESLADFDTMGRNFTPPYNPLVRQHAVELGITLNPEPIDTGRAPRHP